MRALRSMSVFLAGALFLGACGGDDDAGGDVAPTPSGTVTASPTPGPTASPGPSPAPSPSPTAATVTVMVNYPNERKGDVCGEVFPVHREVAADDPVAGAVAALLAGPTNEERDLGYEGWFSSATVGMLQDVVVAEGVAHVDLSSELRGAIPGASSSCGSASLLAMLDRTVLQFPALTDAIYALDGDVAAFYEWLQMSPPDGEEPMTQVDVFFPNEALGDVCSSTFPVPRTVPATAPLRGALDALLAGPTAAERGDGYGGWFSEATAGMLEGVRITDGVAYVDLAAELPDVIPNASTSCGSSSLLAMLDATVTQFPTVDRAHYSLDGDDDAFYEWLQMGVPGA